MTLPPKLNRIVIRDAIIISLDADDRVLEPGDVLIEDGVIALVGRVPSEVDATCDRVIDGRERLVVPGLVNAHTHSPLSVVHGAYDQLNHRASMWLFQAYTARRTPREVYVSALLNCIEMLLSGTTATIDHFPEQAFGPQDVEAVVSAYRDSGMRAVVALRIFDGEYTDILPPSGDLPENLRKAVDENNPFAPRSVSELGDLCGEAIARWNGLDGRIGIFPAPSNPIRCSDELLRMCAKMAEDHDVGIHCHLLETEVQTSIASRRYDRTMVQHLDHLRLLSPRLSCAHTIWIDDEDIDLLAKRGVVIVHNPESNLRSGCGIAPIPKMLARGVCVALGNDGSCSGGDQILQRAMRLATILHRVDEPDPSAWISTGQVLRMATHGGAAAMLSQGRFGSIAVGQAADLALYDLKRSWWTPVNNPVHQFVHSDVGAAVNTVIIDGRIVVDEGRIVAFDADAILAESARMLPAIKERNADLFELAERVGKAVI